MRLLSAAILLLCAACAHRTIEQATTGPVTPADPVHGEARYTAVADPQSIYQNLPADQEVKAPAPWSSNEPPEYPARALEARAGAATVGVRIVIDDRGHVAEVKSSPLIASSGGDHAAEFRGAVESAVMKWRFLPAVFTRLEPGDDYDKDGKPDFRRVVAQKDIPVYIDVRFEFDIVDGKGVVRTGARDPEDR